MTSQKTTIEYSVKDGTAFVTLNRPDVLNSLNRTLCTELIGAFDEAESDPSVRALLLTGSGRAFCAGQDLADIDRLDGRTVRDIVHNQCAKLVRAIQGGRLPYICAVNGVAAGAGANMALCCDIVIASEKASFVQSFVHIGLIPDTAGTYLLPRILGMPRAKVLAMLGDKLPAAEAAQWGLIYKACPPESLLEEAAAICAKLTALPPRALSSIKRVLQSSVDNTLEEQLAMEEQVQAQLGDHADFREGVQAFLEKRKPVFGK